MTAPGANWAYWDKKPNFLQLSVQILAASPTAEVLTTVGEMLTAPATKPATKRIHISTEQGICTPKPPEEIFLHGGQMLSNAFIQSHSRTGCGHQHHGRWVGLCTWFTK